MSLFLREIPEEVADIASKIARLFHRKNRDNALEYEDFLQEVLIELSKVANRHPDNPGLTWSIGANTARDLLRYGRVRNHLSLNEFVEDEDGNTAEWVDLKEDEQAIQEEEILILVGFEQSTSRSFRQLIYKRIAGYPLSATERKRLSRARKKIDVTIREELFDIT